MEAPRLVAGISAATDIAYGMRVLELAREAGAETHLVVSAAGQRTRAYETNPLSGTCQPWRMSAIGLPTSARRSLYGSFLTAGVIVAPCTARRLSAIVYCHGDNLLTRPADVALKERRRNSTPAADSPYEWT